MSTINAVLEPHEDGTLHLPLPPELRNSKVKVTATLQAEPRKSDLPSREQALAALRKLQTLETFKRIEDPVSWQRDLREDRRLPGRD